MHVRVRVHAWVAGGFGVGAVRRLAVVGVIMIVVSMLIMVAGVIMIVVSVFMNKHRDHYHDCGEHACNCGGCDHDDGERYHENCVCYQ